MEEDLIKLGVPKEVVDKVIAQLDDIFDTYYAEDIGESYYQDGVQFGYDEGYREGYEEGYSEGALAEN